MTDRISQETYRALTQKRTSTGRSLAEIGEAAMEAAGKRAAEARGGEAKTQPAPPETRKRNKYSAKKVVTDEGVFDSKLEYKRWRQLKMLEQAGLISGLERQVEYVLELNGVRLGKFTPDYRYTDTQTGRHVVEDAKGVLAREVGLKLRLMKALYGIDVQLWPERKRKSKKAVKR